MNRHSGIRRPSTGRRFVLFIATWFKDHPNGTNEECRCDAEKNFDEVTVEKVEHALDSIHSALAAGRGIPVGVYRPYTQESQNEHSPAIAQMPREPCPSCDVIPDYAGHCRCG